MVTEQWIYRLSMFHDDVYGPGASCMAFNGVDMLRFAAASMTPGSWIPILPSTLEHCCCRPTQIVDSALSLIEWFELLR